MQLQTLVAYFYLRGLDFYGGMPIYRRSTTEESPRSTARETFNYVEELLLAAIPKLEKKTADMLEEPQTLIKQIYDVIGQCAPDYNVEAIYKILLDKTI